MAADYEWGVETIGEYDDDIVDHAFWKTLVEAKQYVDRVASPGFRYSIVLIRTTEGGDRSWAYLREDGSLPMGFRDAYDNVVSPVPPQYLKEARDEMGKP